MDQIASLVSTALISGLLATIVTILWQRKAASYNRKLNVFNILMSYRYMISSEVSVNALNTIDVIFYKDKRVREAFSRFLDETSKKPELNPQIDEKYLKLLEEMAVALKLKNIHWDDIKHSYYPNGLSEKIVEESTLRKLQIESTSVLLNSTRQQQNTPFKNQFTEQAVLQILPELIKNPDSIKTLIELGEKYKK